MKENPKRKIYKAIECLFPELDYTVSSTIISCW